MDTTNRLGTEKTSERVGPHPTRTYNFLLRLSRRLGGVATYSSFLNDIKSLMSQELSVPSTQRLFGDHFSWLSNTQPTPPQVTAEEKAKDLKKIVTQSHELLLSANTVFPMTIFPDTVTVDRTKVTITRRDFFWSSDVMSIRIEDVLNVTASVGPLFGSLTIASRVMSTVDHFQIKHFWRADAIRLKHLIQGYVIAQHNKIDTAHLNKHELIETLIELGHDSAR